MLPSSLFISLIPFFSCRARTHRPGVQVLGVQDGGSQCRARILVGKETSCPNLPRWKSSGGAGARDFGDFTEERAVLMKGQGGKRRMRVQKGRGLAAGAARANWGWERLEISVKVTQERKE